MGNPDKSEILLGLDWSNQLVAHKRPYFDKKNM